MRRHPIDRIPAPATDIRFAARATVRQAQATIKAPHVTIRPAKPEELDALATIWYDAWQDAHAAILPNALRRVRTRDSFRERLRAALSQVRVADVAGDAVGFCIVEGDEMYQLFVTSAARGSGLAAALVADAEAGMAAAGVRTAWLACAIGNDRAARFYEKCGWRRTGDMVSPLPMPDGGVLPLQVWRYEKTLSAMRG